MQGMQWYNAIKETGNERSEGGKREGGQDRKKGRDMKIETIFWLYRCLDASEIVE